MRQENDRGLQTNAIFQCDKTLGKPRPFEIGPGLNRLQYDFGTAQTLLKPYSTWAQTQQHGPGNATKDMEICRRN